MFVFSKSREQHSRRKPTERIAAVDFVYVDVIP